MTQHLTEKDVRGIATYARIGLTDEEVTDEIKQKAVDNLKETILRNMVDDFVYENTVQATTKK